MSDELDDLEALIAELLAPDRMHPIGCASWCEEVIVLLEGHVAALIAEVRRARER